MTKVLIVCSGTHGILSPFIKEQMDSLTKMGIEFSLFQINKRGILGYLLNLKPFRRTVKQIKPDLIHAHYGLSALLANMQFSVPVVTTFHGSDINDRNILKYSKLAHRLSVASIFVEKSMKQRIAKYDKGIIIPCGVETAVFVPIPKLEASNYTALDSGSINILFSSAFDNPVKNYPLAVKACNIAEEKTGKRINLIELKGYTREQVNLLMNVADCVLLTSFSEGSPQFIKEAMACNCPIISTNVGDVKELIEDIEGCYVTGFSAEEISEKIKLVLNSGKRIESRDKIFKQELDAESVAKKIVEVYKNVLISNE